ncbi:class I SAM-dependent methyltransferase [uncultured Flavobacterium sp.]|uniref:class I SAM-dependent methyltransferase n=1 Tax=uncultured Flavobacterium sp. TaxID=165435 RepID=UPI0025E4C966|nr:class I SAM-dependent methyltransferase [uncultured Flavobacterium sp.]
MKTKEVHWQEVYNSRESNEVSWYQSVPDASLRFIEKNVPKNAAIIDVGAGDSNLVDFLVQAGFTDITLLDISQAALNKVRHRLAGKDSGVTYITSDILNFRSERQYAFWHDRAAFHFLTNGNEIKRYTEIMAATLQTDGHALIGTFSEIGPEKCSGIAVCRYSEDQLELAFKENFDKETCFVHDHQTPFDTVQNFIFCSFKKSRTL